MQYKSYKVPVVKHTPLKPIYRYAPGGITTKQRDFIIDLCTQKQIPAPNLNDCSKEKAALIIDKLVNQNRDRKKHEKSPS